MSELRASDFHSVMSSFAYTIGSESEIPTNIDRTPSNSSKRLSVLVFVSFAFLFVTCSPSLVTGGFHTFFVYSFTKIFLIKAVGRLQNTDRAGSLFLELSVCNLF